MRYIGTVYVVRLGESVKVGFSANLPQRLRQLGYDRRCRPDVLRTIDVDDPIRPLRIEHAVHRRFAHLRIHGGWYRADVEILEWAKEQTPIDGAH